MQFTNRFKERVMGYGVANYFLLLLVLMGLFSALFISNTKLNFYTLSILPLWYVLGNFFEQSKDRTVNVIVLLMLSLKAATLFVEIN
jgi:long-subunit acyl-CoA synthetase (AMP-forming)